MSRPLYPFVDWMKGLGMGLIVYGHVAHATTIQLTPPIYLKQLGVALFLFAGGFTLARERRAAGEVVFNRLFLIWLFGLPLAVLIAAGHVVTGSRLELSNFLPFLGGANVFVDNFPANPTTWYLGTYLHLLVLWALVLRHVRVRRSFVVLALAAEIPVRAALIASVGSFVAYMLFTNWAAVFLLGMVQGTEEAHRPERQVVLPACVLLAAAGAWLLAMHRVPFDASFPFMTIVGWPTPVGLLVASSGISLLYLSAAAVVFAATRRMVAPAPVRFIARNTPIIFLAHMPVFFALNPMLAAWGLGYAARVAVELCVCLVGLALLSEGIRALVQPERLRARIVAALAPPRAARATAPLEWHSLEK